MKQPTQSAIDDARRYADEHVAKWGGRITKTGAVEVALEAIMNDAELFVSGNPEVSPEIWSLSSEELNAWVKARSPYGYTNGFTRHNELLALAAAALEGGGSLPNPVREYVARILREIIRKNIRGTFHNRDACITALLVELENRGIPVQPNQETGPQPGQIYGRDLVVAAFKKVGVGLTESAVAKVWKVWSRHPDWAEFRRRTWTRTEVPVRTFFKNICPYDIVRAREHN